AGTETDLVLLCNSLNFDSSAYRLYTSQLYVSNPSTSGPCLTGPFVGAPYAAMVLETLIAWGAKKILFLGWCGSISKKVRIGDIIIPSAAIIDEGTSRHYQCDDTRLSYPSAQMIMRLKSELNRNQIHFHSGTVWSTDAIYRETHQQVKFYQSQDAIAVEMEISALFTVARFRKVDFGAMVVVSDELDSLKWRPGFKMDEFKRGRETACKVIKDVCQNM
ncbi:MAG: nucleoside phosphorylase, partial [Desulfobacterales bacterium]